MPSTKSTSIELSGLFLFDPLLLHHLPYRINLLTAFVSCFLSLLTIPVSCSAFGTYLFPFFLVPSPNRLLLYDLQSSFPSFLCILPLSNHPVFPFSACT